MDTINTMGTNSAQFELLIVGGGNMGGAIARACAANGRAVVVVEPNVSAAQRLIELEKEPNKVQDQVRAQIPKLKLVSTLHEGLGLCAQTATVVLAVKPQIFTSVVPELAQACVARLVVSIMAGVTTAGIEAMMPRARVVRSMPNLGAFIGMSMTALSAGASASREDVAMARGVLATFGEVVEIDESLMDAFTAVAGSGPAFAFYLAEAMVVGACEVGIEERESRRIVAKTLDAAARLLAGAADESQETCTFDAAAWRARVTSKDGTTHAAVESLAASGVREAIVDAVVAARDRGRELGTG